MVGPSVEAYAGAVVEPVHPGSLPHLAGPGMHPQESFAEDELHGQKALSALELDDDAPVQLLLDLELGHYPGQTLPRDSS